MGQAIAVRTDYTSGKLRRLAKRAKDAAQARRLLAIAAVLDGASREEAAKIGGMDRQTLRDWVIRFNEQGPDGLVNMPSPGAPGKLNDEHKAFLARIVEEGPIPAVHGVVRWRACDLIMRLHEEFGLSVSDDTVYRALKELGFSHVSARPKAYKQDPDAMEAFKKNFADRVAEIRAELAPGTPVEVWFQDEMRVGQKNKLTYRWARKGSRPRADPRSTHPIDLSVRRGVPRTRNRRCPRAAGLQHRSHAASSRRDRHQGHPRRPRHSHPRSSRLAWRQRSSRFPSNISLLPLPPRSPELNHQENIWQFMRQNWLSNRIFKSYDDIVDHCCYAWNTLIDQPWKIMSIARRDWAVVGHSM